MKTSGKITCLLLAITLLITQSSCKNRNNNLQSVNTDTSDLIEEDKFPELPEFSEPISSNLAYRSNSSITGYIDGWEARSKNLDATMIMHGDTILLPKRRVMIIRHSHYDISESPMATYNEKGNILFIPGKSNNCPYSYQMFATDSLIVDENGIPSDMDFKLRNISQEQWNEILKDVAPIRIRKDYPIKPVLYYDKGDDYKYAVLFSADVYDKGVVCCGFDYNGLPNTDVAQYFKKALLTYTYLYSQNSYKIPSELYCGLTEWLEIFDFNH